MLAEPRDRARDSLVEGDLWVVVEERARLGEIGDVVRHLAEQGRSEGHLGLGTQFGGNSLRAVH